MKKLRRYVVASALGAFICLLDYLFIYPFLLKVSAQTPRPTPVVLQKTQVVNHDFLAAGQAVDIEGTVNGDVYAAGGTVLVNGVINGDILAAGGQVTIKGTATNIRVTGGQVLIDGRVNGNVGVAGGTVTLGSASSVAGGLVGVGGQMNLLGPIGRTVYVAGGQVIFENIVGSDVSAAVGSLTLTSTARVNGNLWYTSQAKGNLESGSHISGKVTYVPSPQNKKPSPVPVAVFAASKVLGSLYSLIFGFVAGLLLLSLMPVYTKRATDIIVAKTWMSLGLGILAWAVTPFAFVIFAITLIGIPFAILLIIAMVILSYIGRILATIVIGMWFFGRIGQRAGYLWVLLVGLIIYEIISLIPIVGGLFSLVVTFIGLGAVLILEKQYYSDLRAKNLI